MDEAVQLPEQGPTIEPPGAAPPPLVNAPTFGACTLLNDKSIFAWGKDAVWPAPT